jgi:hypothetical protein
LSFLDLKNEFYRPLWIRIVLLCILFGWGMFEFVTGAPFWGVIFAGIGVVALVQWFFSDWAREGQAGGEHSTVKQSQPTNTTGVTDQRDDS